MTKKLERLEAALEAAYQAERDKIQEENSND
jgi:hypothetical protein